MTTSKNGEAAEGEEEEEGNSDEMECFCWKNKRRKRRRRRPSWEGGAGTAGRSCSQPPKKSSENASYSVPVVSPTGAIAVVAVVLFGKRSGYIINI